MIKKNKTIKDKKDIIVFFNCKGGVGKSTVACLKIEWENYKSALKNENIKPKLTDVDNTQVSKGWADACNSNENKRTVIANALEDYSCEIVDTAGVEGSADSYLKSATAIILLFKPQFADIKVSLGSLDSMNVNWKEKTILIPNMVQANKYHEEGINDVINLNKEENWGCRITSPLKNRAELYGELLKGSSENFFYSEKTRRILKNGEKTPIKLLSRAKDASNVMKEVDQFIEEIKLNRDGK